MLTPFERLSLSSASRTCWIFGAGASAGPPYDVPVQSKLLSRLASMKASGTIDLPGLRSEVERICRQVQPGLRYDDPRLSIEEVFSSLELSCSDPIASVDARRDISTLRNAMRVATSVFGRGDAKKYRPFERGSQSSPYAELLEKVFHSKHAHRTNTLVTFNYDICLDRCAIRMRDTKAALDLDYGIPLSNYRCSGSPLFDPPKKESILLLRTHGALNWIRCTACQSTFTTVNRHANVRNTDECWACGRTRLDYVLVHPSFIRSYDDPAIRIIWGRCQEELSRSDRWVFIGYSLPAADVHFRELLRECLRHRNQRNLSTDIVAVGRAPIANAFDTYEALFKDQVRVWNATPAGFADFVARIDP